MTIAEIKTACRKYREARRAMPGIERELETLRRKSESVLTDDERRMLMYAIECKSQALEDVRSVIGIVEKGSVYLPEEERRVIDQLYINGKRWMEVTDGSGQVYPERQAITIWKRAIRRMARNL